MGVETDRLIEPDNKDVVIKRISDRLVIAGGFALLVPLLQLLQFGVAGLVNEPFANINLATLRAICFASAGLGFTVNTIAEYWAITNKGVTLNLKTLPMLGVLKNPMVTVAISQGLEGILTVIENPNTWNQLLLAMEGFRFDKVLPIIAGATQNRDLLTTMTVASMLSLTWAGIHTLIAVGKADPLISATTRFGDWRVEETRRAIVWVARGLAEEKYLNIS